jgi:hypothetical protein
MFETNLKWLADNTILYVRTGSHSYGTNTETSDEDFHGIAIPPVEYFIGFMQKFEQAECKDPDAVIFDIRKFFNLASACNPNIISLLWTDPSDYVKVTKFGQKLIDNKSEFISKRAKFTFAGYSFAQLKRMRLHYAWNKYGVKEPPKRSDFGLPQRTLIPKDQLAAAWADINKKMDSWSLDFLDFLDRDVRIAIINRMSDYLAEIKVSMDDGLWVGAARAIGYDTNFIELLDLERRYTSKQKEWNNYQEWKKNRNPERAALEEKYGIDLKFAYQLVRLLRMAREILTTGQVIVKRPDREELLAIRNGAWSYEKIVEWAENEDKELNELYKTCNVLPHSPDIKKLDDLCIEIVSEFQGQ